MTWHKTTFEYNSYKIDKYAQEQHVFDPVFHTLLITWQRADAPFGIMCNSIAMHVYCTWLYNHRMFMVWTIWTKHNKKCREPTVTGSSALRVACNPLVSQGCENIDVNNNYIRNISFICMLYMCYLTNRLYAVFKNILNV